MGPGSGVDDTRVIDLERLYRCQETAVRGPHFGGGQGVIDLGLAFTADDDPGIRRRGADEPESAPEGTQAVIRAQVPMAEMLTYEQHLTSATGGRGSYHMEYSHYEEVPTHLQSKIIAAARAERGQEATEEE